MARGRWGVLFLCCWVAACDDGGATGGGGGSADRGTGIDLDSGGGFPLFDAALPFDSRVARDGAAGAFGTPCFDNLDCESGFCVPFENRNVCTIRCLDEGCPAGWGCRVVTNTLPDAVAVCLPPNNRLCAACEVDADCPDGRCLTVDGAQVCGLDCVSDESCPPQYACQDVLGVDQPTQCVPRTQSCTCDVNHAGQQRVCEVRNDVGACFGRETCDADTGWGHCTAATPAPEVCNLEDDDCNGFTDDIPGLGEVCERVAEIDGESRACTGRLVCTRETTMPQCTAIDPTAEACNFLDDDCDGEADEDFPSRGAVCVVGVGACRRVGVGECADDGATVDCNVVEGQREAERCDSLDNDCDGSTDEDFPGLSDPCFAGVGACLRAGALRCDNQGQGAECTAVAGEPAAETCDGIDNDCDGNADEGYAGLFESCAVGVGGCRRQGFLYCNEPGDAVVCTALPSNPVVERCDGVDNDCDGTVDEDYAGLNQPCSRGEGLCERAGVSVCAPDGGSVICNAPNADAAAERCDGLDNDCDGQVDEIFGDLNQVCAAGAGACQRIGLVACTPDGAATACTARPSPPEPERCDGLDNDCNGITDEGYAGLGTACSVGIGACEARGVVRCSADGAAAQCDAVAGVARAETCDGLDNNCNGRIDEGFAGLNAPCSDGEGACRVQGVGVCTPDGRAVACNVTAGDGSPETCDGIDNDCNGRIDELFPNVGRPCEAGRGTCRAAGVFVCAPGGAGTVCNAQPEVPAAEVCDGLDNDCNGAVDDGFPGLGAPCTAGAGECLRPGVGVCAADGASVTCNAVAAMPIAEACDGRDNDCDGRVDEGFAGLNTACQAGTGVCRRAGVQVCSADGARVECTAQAAPPGVELCDGVDNDCDGRTDETFPDLNTPCAPGTGVCRRAGVQVCSPDGQSLTCNVQAGMPVAEACDALDNDCDGRTDEGFAGLNTACSQGQGLCRRAGVQVCSADGAAVVCNANAGMPVAEACDAQDNDCDGRTDEGFAGLGTACSAGVGLCRNAGVQICAPDGSRVVCDAVADAPAAEACDAQDNDCDGRTDEGFAGLNTACTVGDGTCRRAGVNVCAANGAGVECNALAGMPVAERCDALDNDCDTRTDEGFAGVGTACVAGTGACQRGGVQVCDAAGAGVTCNAVPGAAVAETCDGIDNDCDARTDETFANLGRVCTVGQGLCRRSGVLVCAANPAAQPVCDAPVVAGAAQEVCDYQDDNCDGRTDEPFVDANGRYTQLAHCGACGNDCSSLWVPNAAAFGVAPRCSVIGGLAQCDYTCLAGFLDADGVANNGCELAIDVGAVYVSTPGNGGADVGACGTVQAPCATMGFGLQRAQAQARTRVRVSDGSYRETVTLLNGISVLGGHHRTTWIRDPLLNVTIINGLSQEPVHRRSVIAIGITQDTTLDGFVINGESPLAEGNSYAVYIRDSNNRLRVTNNRIQAGDGGRGLSGALGPSGVPGVVGAGGLAGFAARAADACAPDPGGAFIRSVGGAGGQLMCGATNVAGGAGGGAKCPMGERQEGTGAAGLTARGGVGGAGAWGLTSANNNTCTVSDGGPVDASPGRAGSPGTDGNGGGGAAAGFGQVAANEWRGNTALVGQSGVPGGGGGGGGSAAGVDILWTAFEAWDIGATGGGGGSGGCHGNGGAPGAWGGGSFGIFVTFSGAGPAVAADLPTLENNEIARSLGGQGGAGGNGGAGGEGANGGAGGARGAGLRMGFCAFQGAPGGSGGRGGHGGGGGGGQGGASFDIFMNNDNNVANVYAARNRFALTPDVNTAGVGGDGGASLNTAIGLGIRGAAGSFGNVGRLP